MQRSGIRDPHHSPKEIPDSAALHPGYTLRAQAGSASASVPLAGVLARVLLAGKALHEAAAAQLAARLQPAVDVQQKS